MRISRVYTKSGDAGETSLVDGSRVSKADLRVAAYGDVDELNSLLGIARIDLADAQLDAELGKIQNELFIVGADRYFVMGDNRGVSEDSRIYGAVKGSQILGFIPRQ